MDVKRAGALATVMSDGKVLKKGDHVTGTVGWTEYAVVKESLLQKVTYVPVLLRSSAEC